MDDKTLFSRALAARELAYAPYSHFTVGAALLCTDGTVYTGCNIENAAFSPTVCAERVALFSAISAGETDLAALAVVGCDKDGVYQHFCTPCGVCRQVLSEFCAPDFQVIFGDDTPDCEAHTLQELLPFAFDL